MTAAFMRWATIFENRPWSSIGSGVVWVTGRISSPIWQWMLPINPVGILAASVMERIKKDVVVFPLVPVIPIKRRALDGSE